MSPPVAENVALIVFAVLPVATATAAWLFFRRLRRAGDAKHPTRVQLVVGNTLILALLLSVGMLGGECYFRFVFDSTDTFGLLRTSDRWFERHFEKNSDSFRDDVEYGLGAVPDGMRRVTFVGDSFTAGHGVPDVADRFANRVRAARTGWDVQVFAMNGWNTGSQAEFLAQRLPTYTQHAYATDLVVLVVCLNDVTDVVPATVELIERLSRARDRGVLAQSSYLFDTLRFLWIANTDEEIGDYFPNLAAAFEGATWEIQKERFVALEGDVQNLGGRLAVVTFPMLHQLGDEYPFRAAHAALDAHWRERGVPHLDLLDTYQGYSSSSMVVGRFDAHPNEEAHRLAAEALLPFLDRVLNERR